MLQGCQDDSLQQCGTACTTFHYWDTPNDGEIGDTSTDDPGDPQDNETSTTQNPDGVYGGLNSLDVPLQRLREAPAGAAPVRLRRGLAARPRSRGICAATWPLSGRRWP
jgi:hypothetical protein